MYWGFLPFHLIVTVKLREQSLKKQKHHQTTPVVYTNTLGSCQNLKTVNTNSNFRNNFQ